MHHRARCAVARGRHRDHGAHRAGIAVAGEVRDVDHADPQRVARDQPRIPRPCRVVALRRRADAAAAGVGLDCASSRCIVVRDAHVLPATLVFVPVCARRARTGARASAGHPPQTLVRSAPCWSSSPRATRTSPRSASHRARLSFHNAIGVRSSPTRSCRTGSIDHGMPLDDALRSRTGQERARRRLLHPTTQVRDVPALGARRRTP